MENFKQEDLKTGMIAKLRNGDFYKVYKGSKFKDCLVNQSKCFLYMKDYDRFKFCNYVRQDLDIVKVYAPRQIYHLETFDLDCFDLTWEKSKPIKMTIEEIEEKLGIENLEIVEEN